jgi:hypothetical protein
MAAILAQLSNDEFQNWPTKTKLVRGLAYPFSFLFPFSSQKRHSGLQHDIHPSQPVLAAAA